MCKCNPIYSLSHPVGSRRIVQMRVVLFVLRWLRGSKIQGDGRVGSLLFFQFELCCFELINLCRGDRQAAAQLDWLVFSSSPLCIKPERNLLFLYITRLNLNLHKKTNPLRRMVSLFRSVCCREWVWPSRVAGFPQRREQRQLPLCTAPVWPVGHGSPPLQTALRLRPGHEPNRGQVRLAGGVTRKDTSQLHGFCSNATLKPKYHTMEKKKLFERPGWILANDFGHIGFIFFKAMEKRRKKKSLPGTSLLSSMSSSSQAAADKCGGTGARLKERPVSVATVKVNTERFDSHPAAFLAAWIWNPWEKQKMVFFFFPPPPLRGFCSGKIAGSRV